MSNSVADPGGRSFDVFLSHNSRDKSAVELLAHRLKEEARLQPFLDKWHLVPGESWQAELEKALGESESVAVFFGASGVSPWHHAELRLALSRAVSSRDECRVIPILLPGANPEDLEGFISQRTWVDFRSGLDDADAFKRLVAGIKGLAPASDTYRLPDEPAPYRGLLPFDKAHARFFFGRDSEIQTVLDKLKQHPFVAVVGASGVGKSSLVRGGVLPRLEDPAAGLGPRPYIKTMTPGDRPLRALADQLATLVPPADRLRTAEDLAWRLASRPEALCDAVRTLTAGQPGIFVLVVDQLEELFTLATGEGASKEVAAFVSNLRDAVEQGRGSLKVIVTLRADFFERCLNMPALRELMQEHQVLLGCLGPDALRDAIVRPAQAVGAFLEKGLVGTILKDVSQEPGTLPLLEHALYELWRARRGAWLTLSAYEASGGVAGALQRRAQACYEALNPEERDLARQLFLRLTSQGEGTPDTRRRMARAELAGVSAEQVEHVLGVLSGPETRLLVADGDTVEVAHEALIHEWPTLRQWLDEGRQEWRVLRRLTEAANEWDKQKRDSSYLYTGSRLLEAEERFAKNPGPLNQRERDFLRASLEHRDAERREKEARKQQEFERAQQLAREAEARRRAEAERARTEALSARRLKVLVLMLAVAGLGIFVLWQQAQQERKQAQQERDNARSRELTTKSLMELRDDPRKSRLDIEEAWRIAPNEDIAKALSAWSKEPGLMVLREHRGSVLAAAFSPDGSRILTANEDSTARVWDAFSGKLLHTLSGHSDAVVAAAFSPDGSRILTASGDKTARVWGAVSGKLLHTLSGHADAVVAAAFSPDGSRILTASGDDATARVWDAASGTLLHTLFSRSIFVKAATFSPDGSRIVTANQDSTARVWDASSGKLLHTLSGHIGAVKAATFSPDGSRILTASSDKTARVWGAVSGKLLHTLSGHSDAVVAVAFSPDGSRILTASSDKTARVWDAVSGTLLHTLSGHSDAVVAAAFSPDGSRILTANQDSTARVWDAVSGTLLHTLSGHVGAVTAAAFSPDGARVLTASTDKTARVWDVDSDKAATCLFGHSGVGMAATFSPDGSRILIASSDRTARVWDSVSGTLLHTLSDHSATVVAATFSPDGSRILTASLDSTARVWDAASGKRLHFLFADAPLMAAAFSPDGSRILTVGEDSTTRVWNAASGKLLHILSGHSLYVWAATFSPDGSRILTASLDSTARVWDAASGKLRYSLFADASLRAAAFSPDGSRILTASTDKTARVWDAASGKLLQTLSGHSDAVVVAAFSPDGSRILTASSDKTARVWDAASGKLLHTLSGHSDAVVAAAFSPDGSRILTASSDKTARVWDAVSGTLLHTLSGHVGAVKAAAFSPDGSRILTTSRDNTARVWSCWNWSPIETQIELASQLEAGRQPVCTTK
ncbi:nSTAND1 domain-containing NTPase [Archangium lansingense]|uniref:TIR domain-containing protein n=1 Tax=Archangium lansingense TaxID=2995310 RepID=A0ABT4A099_9BACT|nr:TIR domain-containing protein [Archangium lansinium]MCY1075073.1 TIR domain-containing protein [Archangium lansinium]